MDIGSKCISKCARYIKGKLKPNNRPYQHFQVQGHSENVLHKNGRSSICLSQVYAPKIARKDTKTHNDIN